jgi:hypothetical protein
MTEHTPIPEVPEFRYDSPRDQALHLMVAQLWGEKHSGDPQSEQGLFGHISNYPQDAPALEDAFGPDLTRLGCNVADVTGHFIVIVDEDFHVTVEEFNTRHDAHRAYSERDGEYLIWLSQQRSQA